MSPKTGLRAIFVTGCERSGTTLLGAMIGAHSRCICPPEAQFVDGLLRKYRSIDEQIAGKELRRDLENDPRFGLWRVPRSSLERHDGEKFTPREWLEELVRSYSSVVGKTSADTWVDHTPSNASRALRLLELFPDARYIHIIRDGRAAAASLIQLDWGPRSADRAAYFWLRSLSFGLAAEAALGKDRMLSVRYEDLVSQPRATLRRICGFLPLEYQDTMSSGKGFQVPDYSRRQHRLVGSCPDPSRIDAWRTDLSYRQIEVFESIVGDMLQYLGYEPLFGKYARPMSSWERLASTMGKLVSILLNIKDQLSVRYFAARNRLGRLAVRKP